jgi:hypothetical protein
VNPPLRPRRRPPADTSAPGARTCTQSSSRSTSPSTACIPPSLAMAGETLRRATRISPDRLPHLRVGEPAQKPRSQASVTSPSAAAATPPDGRWSAACRRRAGVHAGEIGTDPGWLYGPSHPLEHQTERSGAHGQRDGLVDGLLDGEPPESRRTTGLQPDRRHQSPGL